VVSPWVVQQRIATPVYRYQVPGLIMLNRRRISDYLTLACLSDVPPLLSARYLRHSVHTKTTTTRQAVTAYTTSSCSPRSCLYSAFLFVRREGDRHRGRTVVEVEWGFVAVELRSVWFVEWEWLLEKRAWCLNRSGGGMDFECEVNEHEFELYQCREFCQLGEECSI